MYYFQRKFPSLAFSNIYDYLDLHMIQFSNESTIFLASNFYVRQTFRMKFAILLLSAYWMCNAMVCQSVLLFFYD